MGGQHAKDARDKRETERGKRTARRRKPRRYL